jgi:small GTP-binding protein
MKILTIGDPGVGKSALVRRLTNDSFREFYKVTIGVDFGHKELQSNETTLANIQCCDIAGQERDGNMTRVYYPEAVGAIVVSDLTRSTTREAALIWKKDLDQKVQTSTEAPLPTILIGTKIDMLGPVFDLERVQIENAGFAQANGFLRVLGESAKDRIDVEEPVRFLPDYLDRNYITHEDSALADSGVNIAADQDDDSLRRSCW